MTHFEELKRAQERTERARKALKAAQDELTEAMRAERDADAALLRHTLTRELGVGRL